MRLSTLVLAMGLLVQLSRPGTLFADDTAGRAIAEPAQQTASQSTPQGTPTPDAPQPSKSATAQAVEGALQKLKITGYLQAQYVHDERSRNDLSGSSSRNLDQFSVRRGRIKFTYQATPTSRMVIQPDITSSGVVLKDGYVELTEPWTTWRHTLTAGQFNWPYGFEVGYSSSHREVPERSRVVRTLFPGERDRGLMLSGAGLNKRLTYRIAVVNGTGTAQSSDLNQEKDIVGRLGYTMGPVTVGASVYRGDDLVVTSTAPQGRNFAKERSGIDVQWTTPVPGLTFRAESIRGQQAPTSGTSRTQSHDVEGWYLYAIQKIGTRHQLALRVDEYDADTDVAGNAIRTISPAYTFHWDKHSRVLLAHDWIRSERNDPDDNVLTLRYQFSF